MSLIYQCITSPMASSRELFTCLQHVVSCSGKTAFVIGCWRLRAIGDELKTILYSSAWPTTFCVSHQLNLAINTFSFMTLAADLSALTQIVSIVNWLTFASHIWTAWNRLHLASHRHLDVTKIVTDAAALICQSTQLLPHALVMLGQIVSAHNVIAVVGVSYA